MTNTAEQNRTFTFTIRPMDEAGIPAFVDYANEMTRLEPVDDGVTLGEFTDWFHSPMNRSTYYLAHEAGADGSEGRIIGSMDFSYNPEDGRAWGWLDVHPDYRLRGVGSALYNRFMELTREKNARSVHLTPNVKQHLTVQFLERRGWTLDRYFWQMRYDAKKPLEELTLPEGFSIRNFVRGQDEPLWMHVRNATFAEHYGSVNRTLEEIQHIANEEHFRPEALFFAFEGDKIAGFCFTAIDPREEERLGYSVGHVHNIGTMPEYRGRGVGRALLLAGMHYLRPQVSMIELGVEGKNERALRLYESVGFEPHRSWANMTTTLSGE